MKRLYVIPLIFSMAFMSFFLISCSKDDTVNQTGNTNPVYQVNIQGGKFNPDTLKALPGHDITWRNLDAVVHTVVSDDNTTFNSGNINPGGSFIFNAPNTFTYPYHCSIHPNEKGVLAITSR